MTQTAKQKAEELVNSFLQAINYKNDEGKLIIHQEPYTSAKQCAIICVEEILNNDGFTQFDIYLTEYWNEVKTEIEAL